MIDLSHYHQGFLAGYVPGFLMGLGLMKMAWDHEDKRRHRRMGPPKGSYGGRLDPGRIQRGNGSGGPTTPKPDIIPKPQFPSPRKIREDFLP